MHNTVSKKNKCDRYLIIKLRVQHSHLLSKRKALFHFYLVSSKEMANKHDTPY